VLQQALLLLPQVPLPLLAVLRQLLHLEVELVLEVLVLHHPVEVVIKAQMPLRVILIQVEVAIKTQIPITVEVAIKTQIPLRVTLIQVVWPLILSLTRQKKSRMK